MQLSADFSALIERFSDRKDAPVAVAVSGGSDSLALLYLLNDWASRAHRRLLVLTVDHCLRAESDAEAQIVADQCAALSIAHETLRWETPKRSQNLARRARYRLLGEAAKRYGAQIILTGHTLDDVIETVFIRRRRGIRTEMSVGPSLAAPLPIWPEGRGLTVLRPLVRVRRSALQDFLRHRQVEWLSDPSNENVAFERVRVRQFFKSHPSLYHRSADLISEMQARRQTADAQFAAQLSQTSVAPDGLIDTESVQISDRLLVILGRCASGGDRDPRLSAVTLMRESLDRVGARQTLGGAWFQRTAKGYLVGRDPGEASHGGGAKMFDGRFEKTCGAGARTDEPAAFLVRHAMPDGAGWTEIISKRISHLARCFETPFLTVVEG